MQVNIRKKKKVWLLFLFRLVSVNEASQFNPTSTAFTPGERERETKNEERQQVCRRVSKDGKAPRRLLCTLPPSSSPYLSSEQNKHAPLDQGYPAKKIQEVGHFKVCLLSTIDNRTIFPKAARVWFLLFFTLPLSFAGWELWTWKGGEGRFL